MNVDKQHQLIRRDTVTDASVHDSQVLEEVLQSKAAGRDVWGDAAYRSEAIDTQLKKRKLRSKIQSKAYRDKPLTAKQIPSNQHRSCIRARVEQVFGHQVTAMGGKLIRTIGRVRACAKIELKNLTNNFQRFLVLRGNPHHHGTGEAHEAKTGRTQAPPASDFDPGFQARTVTARTNEPTRMFLEVP